ncbi:MAG: hypothetical protein A3D44_01130 [Candidatus Staskawiczbacteria bacterium RIFCSPHIGHO2_02_FULL_42_22]|uniref:Uncharacterized protein n=1 Tax=Candidatus Staskawiczbacteria bacterium RIFCSPHIGHO2_02_FULL_42_22 TaxID=1802207 RepID=A0A1G2I393_9BACT|nr:MAG: hypothetical protein A3D44_01130 [Candidatus Staskawiczbacteria bacterium RIFCSPHIGHO2_02_FULL_42_22]
MLGPNPSNEARWAAEDLCINAGWLSAIGAESDLPANWKMMAGGAVARNALEVVIGNLQGLKKDISKLLKVVPPRKPGESLESFLLRVLGLDGSGHPVFGYLLDANEEEVVCARLSAWAAAVAIRQSSQSKPLPSGAYRMIGGQLRRFDPGAQFLGLLSDLKQVEAEVDGMLVDPIISTWLQEEIGMRKKDPFVQAVQRVGITQLPNFLL